MPAATLSIENHPLWQKFLEPELSELNEPVVVPNKTGFKMFDANAGSIKVSGFDIGFDPSTGSINRLTDSRNNSWASSSRMLLGLNYQTYNISQFQQFQRAYSNLTKPPGYFPHDFGKPNDTEAVYNNENATALSFWYKESSSEANATFLIETQFQDASLHTEYGAPSFMWTVLEISDNIAVSILLMNKTATRHAEAMFLQITPPEETTMEMDKLGTWMKLESGLVVDGGNKHMHGVNTGVRVNSTTGSMIFETIDAGVIVFGRPVS